MDMGHRIWITWEYQRRSIELSKHFKCKLFVIQYKGWLRFPLSLLSTLKILIKEKATVVFVQNPSMLLAGIACLYGLLSRVPIIVDRHSNFLLTEKKRSYVYLMAFKIIHMFTIKYANLTIITNQFLAQKVKKIGGKPFILQDKIPTFANAHILDLKGKKNLFLISSFHLDEPIQEVIESMREFTGQDICLYISGNYNKLDKKVRENAPANIKFTGFLDEDEFINMLFSVDVIIVLTKIEYCMLCGCYEALAAGKPLLTSNKEVLKSYFYEAFFVDNTKETIVVGIKYLLKNLETYRKGTILMREKLKRDWVEKAMILEKKVQYMEEGRAN